MMLKLITHYWRLLTDHRYRCWSRGRHIYRTRVRRIAHRPGDPFRCVLEVSELKYSECDCCGHMSHFGRERKVLDRYQGATLLDSEWRKMDRQGFIDWS